MSSGIEKKKKRRRIVKKHRNLHGGSAAVAPPGRLGWLGEGLSINDEQQFDNNFNGSQSSGGGLGNNNKHNDSFINGSQSSSERLLTPRPDDDNDTKISGMSKNNGSGAVDLTADDSDDCNNIKNSSSWTCRKCTLVNSVTVSVCDACNTRRESTRSSNSKRCTNNNEIESDDELLGGYDGDESQAIGKNKHKRLKKGSGSSNTTTSQKTDDTAVATKKDQKKKKKKKKSNSSSSNNSNNGKKYQSTLLSEHFSTQTNNNNKHKMKKSKPTTYKQHSFKNNSLSKSTAKTTNTEMWIDKHAPQTIKELCVAPKKIEEVRQFLNSHVEYTTYQRRRTNHNKQHHQSTVVVNPWDIPTNPSQPTTKLQILVGSPGIGKSTLLSVLATELNIEVLRWNDIHVDYNMNGGEYGMGSRGRDNGGGGGHLPYQSQLSSFEEFLNSGSVGITSLDIGGDNTSSLKLSSSAEKKKRKGSSSSGKNSEEYAGSLILVEEVSFLSRFMCIPSLLCFVLKQHMPNTTHTLLKILKTPNLYNDEAAQSFRRVIPLIHACICLCHVGPILTIHPPTSYLHTNSYQKHHGTTYTAYTNTNILHL